MNNQLFKLFSLVTGPKSYIPPTPAVEYNNATGGTITEYTNSADGRKYRVHTFTANDSFAVTKSVAPFRAFACGGGGNAAFGGGGGGRALENLTLQIPVGSHPVTVGGSAQATSLGSIISSPPGDNGNPWDGGNSRGGNSNYPGGSPYLGGYSEVGGGGGGAGGPGASPGDGGIGIETTIRGLVEKFGGGGGGGGARDSNPGSGQDGGGNGTKGYPGGAGAANTGGGGGGGGLSPQAAGGPGGSGILIVSYEIAPGDPPPTYNDATGGTITEYLDAVSGLKYRVHTFDAGGTLDVTAAIAPFSVLACGGGSSGGGGSAYCTTGPRGTCGTARTGSVLLDTGAHPVIVGGVAGTSSFSTISGQGAGGGARINSDISGTTKTYPAAGGGDGACGNPGAAGGAGTFPGGEGGGGGGVGNGPPDNWNGGPGGPGAPGQVIIRYQIAS